MSNGPVGRYRPFLGSLPLLSLALAVYLSFARNRSGSSLRRKGLDTSKQDRVERKGTSRRSVYPILSHGQNTCYGQILGAF
jgi:hypothetical protein